MLRKALTVAIGILLIETANAQLDLRYNQSLHNYVYTMPAFVGWHGGAGITNTTQPRFLASSTAATHEIGLKVLLFQDKAQKRFIKNLPLL